MNAARYVVDASVAAKWLLREPGRDRAKQLLEGSPNIHAPELCLVEVANVIWKLSRRHEMTPSESITAMELLARLPIRLHSHQPILNGAFVIAMRSGISMYDALYVALAQSLNATLVTADRQLAAAVETGAGWSVRLI